MNNIINYIISKNMDAVFVNDGMSGDRIEFDIRNFKVSIVVTNEMTLTEFSDKVNEKYLSHLKTQAMLYKSMGEGFEKRVKEFKSVFY